MKTLISDSVSRATVLVFRLGTCRFAIPISLVEEVLPALALEPAPGCPGYVRGIVLVGGVLLPVLDIAERLAIPGHRRRTTDPHIVCLRWHDRTIGIEVDEALDLIDIEKEEITTADEFDATDGIVRGSIVRGDSVVCLLDAERLITGVHQRTQQAATEGT